MCSAGPLRVKKESGFQTGSCSVEIPHIIYIYVICICTHACSFWMYRDLGIRLWGRGGGGGCGRFKILDLGIRVHSPPKENTALGTF